MKGDHPFWFYLFIYILYKYNLTTHLSQILGSRQRQFVEGGPLDINFGTMKGFKSENHNLKMLQSLL